MTPGAAGTADSSTGELLEATHEHKAATRGKNAGRQRSLRQRQQPWQQRRAQQTTRNKKKKQKKSKRSKKHRKGGKSSSSDESDTESSTSDSEESTGSSSQDSSSEDDKKGKRKTKKSSKDKKCSKDRNKKSKKEKQGRRKKRGGEKKHAVTPTKETNDEEKRELRARLEAEQLRARMWQELCEASGTAERGSQQRNTTPCRRGVRTPQTGQSTKKNEEDEGRGMNVAEALRRAGENNNNGQEDRETQ